ncbi:MAG: hypothetical protein K2N03_08970, partial [Muribaculaceae bacterium]|nr:hypothetical protein [Muribaculaceae bacterium]
MINKIAIISSLSPDIAINLFNFFKEGNRVAVDCVISDNSHSQEFSETLSNQGIPLFNFPVAAWESSPETILDFLRSRNISLLLVDHFDLPGGGGGGGGGGG